MSTQTQPSQEAEQGQSRQGNLNQRGSIQQPQSQQQQAYNQAKKASISLFLDCVGEDLTNQHLQTTQRYVRQMAAAQGQGSNISNIGQGGSRQQTGAAD